MNEKIAGALKVLQAEGLRVVLLPEKVTVSVGRVEIHSETANSNGVQITLDGNRIESMLRFAQVTAEVGDVISFEIKFGGIA